MAVRIRKDGTILCAAMHEARDSDAYIDDGLHYLLSIEAKVLVTDDNHLKRPDGTRGHGQWWWNNRVPKNITISEFYKEVK